MMENCSKCQKELGNVFWQPVNQAGNPKYSNSEDHAGEKYCAGCMKSKRKELCKNWKIKKMDGEDNHTICPFCTRKWELDNHQDDDWDDIVKTHYAHHLDGRNPRDDNPDFQITERERERAEMEKVIFGG